MSNAKNPGNKRGRPTKAADAAIVPLATSAPDPDPPPGLNEAGERVWRFCWAKRRGVYDDSDRLAVLQFSKLFDVEADLEAAVAEGGQMVMGSQGQMVLNPAARHLNDIRKEIRAASKDLALQPRDRFALLGQGQQANELEDFIAGASGS